MNALARPCLIFVYTRNSPLSGIHTGIPLGRIIPCVNKSLTAGGLSPDKPRKYSWGAIITAIHEVSGPGMQLFPTQTCVTLIN